jgi:hypothetical protein
MVDGLVTFGSDPANHARLYGAALDAWRDAGREGKPRFVGGTWFALGPDAEDKAVSYLKDYFGFKTDQQRIEMLAGLRLVDESNISAVISRFEEIGLDELFLTPLIGELDQIDRLAGLVT